MLIKYLVVAVLIALTSLGFAFMLNQPMAHSMIDSSLALVPTPDSSPVVASSPSAVAARVTSLEDEVAKLAARMSNLNKLLGQQSESTESPELTTYRVNDIASVNDEVDETFANDSADDPVLPPAMRILQSDRYAGDTLSKLDEHFTLDTDDNTNRWSEDELSTAFASDIGGTLLETSCRSSICRLELAFDDRSSRDHTVALVPGITPWKTQNFVYADSSDPTKMIVFVAKKDQTLTDILK